MRIKIGLLFFKNVNPELITMMRDHNWNALAAGFNGPYYKKNSYDKKLAAAYKRWSSK